MCAPSTSKHSNHFSQISQSSQAKPVPQQDKGLQGQNNGKVKLTGSSALPQIWSHKPFPGIRTNGQDPEVITSRFPFGSSLCGPMDKSAWGQFHCLSGCLTSWESFPSQVRWSWLWNGWFSLQNLPFFFSLPETIRKLIRLPWKFCFHRCLFNNHLLSQPLSLLGCPFRIKWSRKAMLSSSPPE